jgi:hypothetical protein
LADQDIYEAIAFGLSRLMEPMLQAYSADEIALAMGRVLRFQGPDPGFRAFVRERVGALSDGLTRLEDADPAEFPERSKDPSVWYVRVVGPVFTRLAMIGNFTRPVQLFDVPAVADRPS